ncbi:putative ribonuclease H protein [Citrus sinensis]|nr:putative ribonuclease H protein [Citrus sinensis]
MKKMSMVKWDNVCKPKTWGGLGLKRIDAMNNALLIKIGWSLITSSDSLWVKVLRSKYGIEDQAVPQSLNTKSGSYMWKAIGIIWDKVLQGIRWNLGDGRKVKFWWDCWALKDKRLIFYAQQPLPEELINSTVSDCVNGDGSWNWGLFANLLPDNVILRIAPIKPPLNSGGKDEIRWAHSKTGIFKVKSAYLYLIQQKKLTLFQFLIKAAFWRLNSTNIYIYMYIFPKRNGDHMSVRVKSCNRESKLE